MQARNHPTYGLLSKRQRNQLDTSFGLAQTKLQTHQGQGPFVLASKGSQEVFDAWDNDNKACWAIAYEQSSQSILMYGDPFGLHSNVRGFFDQSLQREWTRLTFRLSGISDTNSTHAERERALDKRDWPHGYGRTTIYTEKGAKSPDASYYADGLGVRSVVLEIAHRNESFKALLKEVAWWHAAGVGLALGIYIDPKSDHSNPNLILLSQTHEQSTIKQQRFGCNSGCTAPKLPKFQLQIPLRYVCNKNLQSLGVYDKFLPIDLYEVQQDVISCLQFMQAA